jgi:hypothetical protein
MANYMHDKSSAVSSQTKVKKVTSHGSKEKYFNDKNNHARHRTNITSMPSRSSISFSSSSFSKVHDRQPITTKQRAVNQIHHCNHKKQVFMKHNVLPLFLMLLDTSKLLLYKYQVTTVLFDYLIHL